jgi:O-glycosyl hydrolase
VKAFLATAPAIRAHDPKIEIIADSWHLKYIEPVMADPESRKLVDSLVLHHVGCDANVVTQEVARFRAKFGNDKPLYQNEYEYLWVSTTPARCMNTVLHIMNWLQIGEAPSWYWIHALKPITVVLANRSFTAHTFKVASGLRNATFRGIRYTPDEAGKDSMGVEICTLQGGTLTPKVPGMAWEFWEQQD